MNRGGSLLAVILAASLQLQTGHVAWADEAGGVETWVAALKGKDVKARAEAARALGKMGAKAKAAATPALVEVLGDQDREVQVAAAAALGRLDGPLQRVLPILLEARTDADDEIRAAAVSAWEAIGPGVRSTVLYMPEMLRNPNVQTQQKAAAAFGKHGLEAVPALIDLLTLDHAPQTTSGIFIAPAIPYGGFPQYDRLNSNSLQMNTRLRTIAIETLGKWGPEILPTLLVASKDREPKLREGAVQAMGTLKLEGEDRDKLIGVFADALRDRDSWVRQRAVEALAKNRKASPAAMEVLAKALGHQDTMVRRAVVQALAPASRIQPGTVFVGMGRMQGVMAVTTTPVTTGPAIPPLGTTHPALVPALVAALDDSDSYVRLKAAETLAQINPPIKECLPELVDLLSDRDDNIGQLAGRTLESLGPRAKEVAPALREVLKLHPNDPAVRVIVARVLGRTGPEEEALALTVLRETLDSDAPHSRLQAAESLWDLGHAEEAIPVIVAALSTRDGSNNLSNQARQIFQQRNSATYAKLAVPALIEALKDDDSNTNNQILQLLQQMGPAVREATPELIKLLTSNDNSVRFQVIQILRQQGKLPKEAAPAVVAMFKKIEPGFRNQLIPLLGQLGSESKQAIPALVELLKDPNQGNRFQALQVLRQVAPQAPKEAAGALVEVMKDKDAAIRTQAGQILGQLAMGGEASVPVVVEMLKDPLPANRLQAIQIVGQLGRRAKSALPVIVEAMKDKDAAVRSQAVQALGRMGPQVVAEHSAALKESLKDPDPTVRVNALTALTSNIGMAPTGSLPVTSAINQPPATNLSPALIELMADTEPNIRLQAVLRLSQLSPSRNRDRDKAIDAALMDRLDDADRLVRLRAAQALAYAPVGSEEAKAGLRGLAAALEETRPDIRSQAAGSLGRLGLRAVEQIPALTARLKDPELSVRYEAALALCQIGSTGVKAATPVLIEVAKAGETNHRLGAIMALRRIGAAENKLILPTLLELLRSSESNVSYQAGEALSRLGPLAREAIPELVEMLEDSNPNTRFQAARILGQLGPAGVKAAAPILIELLKAGDRNARSQALGMIQSLPGADLSPAIAVLIEMLNEQDPNQNSRYQAIQILGQLGPRAKDAAPSLRELVKTAQTPYRLQAALALSQIAGTDEPTLLPVLEELLHDSQISTRIQAAQLLVQTGPEGVKLALPTLIESLETTEQQYAKHLGLQGLGHLRGAELKQALPKVIALLDDSDPSIRHQALIVLGQFGPEASPAIPALVELLAKPNLGASGPSVAQVLGLLSPEAVPALVESLKTVDGSARTEVVRTLGRIGPAATAAVPALLELLEDDDASLRSAAVAALPEIGLDAVEPLAGRLNHESPAVRLLAVEALGQVGPGAHKAVPALTRVLNDKTPLVRVAAANALGVIGGDRHAELVAPILAEGLKDDDVNISRTAATALARFATTRPELAPELTEALKKRDGLTRLNAAEALARLPGRTDEAVTVLTGSLDDAMLRPSALKALERLGPAAKGAVPSLVDRLNETSDEPIAGEVAGTLARIAGAAAVDPLLEAFAKHNSRSQPMLIAALSLTGPAGVAPLARLRAHDDSEVRILAVRALATLALEVEPARSPLREALSDKETKVRIEAAIGLAKLGSESGAAAFPTLLAAAQDLWLPERLRAIEALEDLGSTAAPAVSTLIQALKEKDAVRLAAAKALGRIGAPAKPAVPALERTLNDTELQIRGQAAIVLWDVTGNAEVSVPQLVETLRSPALRTTYGRPRSLTSTTTSPPFVPITTELGVTYYRSYPGQSTRLPVPSSFRLEIIKALGRMKGQASAAVPALRDAAKEADAATRTAATEALEAIAPSPAGATGVEVQ